MDSCAWVGELQWGRNHFGREWPGVMSWEGKDCSSLGPKKVSGTSPLMPKSQRHCLHLCPLGPRCDLAFRVAHSLREGLSYPFGGGRAHGRITDRESVTLGSHAVPAGAVCGASTWLALRSRVPDSGRNYHATVPAQALRWPSHPSLPVRALAFSVHLHQDFGEHVQWERQDPGRAVPRSGGL